MEPSDPANTEGLCAQCSGDLLDPDATPCCWLHVQAARYAAALVAERKTMPDFVRPGEHPFDVVINPLECSAWTVLPPFDEPEPDFGDPELVELVEAEPERLPIWKRMRRANPETAVVACLPKCICLDCLLSRAERGDMDSLGPELLTRMVESNICVWSDMEARTAEVDKLELEIQQLEEMIETMANEDRSNR